MRRSSHSDTSGMLERISFNDLQVLPSVGAAASRVSGLTGPEVWEMLEYVGKFNRVNTAGAGVKRAPGVAVEGLEDEDEEGLLDEGGDSGGSGGGSDGEGGLLRAKLVSLDTSAKTVDKLSRALCSSGENCKRPLPSTKSLQLKIKLKFSVLNTVSTLLHSKIYISTFSDQKLQVLSLLASFTV